MPKKSKRRRDAEAAKPQPKAVDTRKQRMLWIYCIVACVLLVITGIVVIGSSGAQVQELQAATVDQEAAESEASEQQQRVEQLEEDQRAARATLSGPEALEMSTRVQVAQGERDGALMLRDVARGRTAAAREVYEKRMTWMVPVIALLLVHFVGMFLVRPRRSS